MAKAVAWLLGKPYSANPSSFLKTSLAVSSSTPRAEGAGPELRPEAGHRLPRALAGHGAAELIRLPGAEPGQGHRHAEHLLLVEDDAECFAQDRFQ